MNTQQAFQKSALHILGQQHRCAVVEETGDNVTCVYAGPEGQACAVGCLLPRRIAERLDKAKLSAWIEVLGSTHPAAMAAKKHLRGVDNNLLEDLQSIHDHNPSRGSRASCRTKANKRVIRRKLMELGTEMGLRVDFLKA